MFPTKNFRAKALGEWIRRGGPGYMDKHEFLRKAYDAKGIKYDDRIAIDTKDSHSHEFEAKVQIIQSDNPTFKGAARMTTRVCSCGEERRVGYEIF